MKPDITTRLVTLGLRGLAAQLPDIIASATKKRWGAEIIEHIALTEETERARRGLERRSTQSKLSKWKPMADFDWNWPTKIDRGLVESLLTLDFVEHANNVVLVANSGLGKTMIAQNLVHTAVLKGRSALFISASDLLLDLSGQESPRALERKLRHYAKIGLLVVDEVGFIPFESRNADLFFQLVSRRYEKKSLVLTTNLAFTEWNKIFPKQPAPQPSSSASCTTHRDDRGRELPSSRVSSSRVSGRRAEAQRRPEGARQVEGVIRPRRGFRVSNSALCRFRFTRFGASDFRGLCRRFPRLAGLEIRAFAGLEIRAFAGLEIRALSGSATLRATHISAPTPSSSITCANVGLKRSTSRPTPLLATMVRGRSKTASRHAAERNEVPHELAHERLNLLGVHGRDSHKARVLHLATVTHRCDTRGSRRTRSTVSTDTPTRSATSTGGISTESNTWISRRLSSGSISAASHSVPSPYRPSSSKSSTTSRALLSSRSRRFSGTPQIFWNHQERLLEAEMSVHLGHGKNTKPIAGQRNRRNGHGSKTVHTETGSVTVAVPRDREGSFEPIVIPKNQRMRDIQAHLRELYGAEVSHELISEATEGVMEEMRDWQRRTLDAVYPIVYLDALFGGRRGGAEAARDRSSLEGFALLRAGSTLACGGA